MKVEILNIGLPKKEVFHGKEIFTGICKKPVSGPLRLTEMGFESDGVGDTKNHGGSDKAVCVYSLDHYPYWEEVLGIKLPDAAFGENLSVSDIKEEDIYIGDIFEVGTATVQVSQPRQPCKTLSARYGRNDMAKLVVDSGRTGFYLRVLKEGVVKAGDSLILKERESHNISISRANQIFHHERKNLKGIETLLAVESLSESWKQSLKELKEKCS